MNEDIERDVEAIRHALEKLSIYGRPGWAALDRIVSYVEGLEELDQAHHAYHEENEKLKHTIDLLKDTAEVLRKERDELREALREIAGLTKGLEGQTAQRLMMDGVSPMGLLSRGRDIARSVFQRTPRRWCH